LHSRGLPEFPATVHRPVARGLDGRTDYRPSLGIEHAPDHPPLRVLPREIPLRERHLDLPLERVGLWGEDRLEALAHGEDAEDQRAVESRETEPPVGVGRLALPAIHVTGRTEGAGPLAGPGGIDVDSRSGKGLATGVGHRAGQIDPLLRGT